MSQHSDSPRLEALESSVSGIQETMSELVGMLRQLTTETRTAGDGRRGEESGGAEGTPPTSTAAVLEGAAHCCDGIPSHSSSR